MVIIKLVIMSNHNLKKGAQWLKWDLHLHTPDTKLNNAGFEIKNKDKWEKYCEILENSDVAVFGITDYFSVDNYFKLTNIFREKYRCSNKVFFPNIEFRLDVSVNNKAEEVNIHVLFSNDTSESDIKNFLSKLETAITVNTVKKTCDQLKSEDDFKKASINYNDLKDTLKKVFGNNECYIILSACNNQGIRPDNKSLRKMMISDEIDKICQGFFGNSNSTKHFLKEDRYEADEKGQREISKKCPVFTGSDAHSFDDLEHKLGKTYIKKNNNNEICDSSEITWIKADPTFDGLKQVLIEPEERVYIGKTPPIIEKINNNRTKYIKSLSINSVEDYDGKHGKWFDNVEIDLNPELVAIIGNKGSGKSALADIIGLCGNHKKNFSFLNENKFKKGDVSKYFNANLKWVSDELTMKRKLSDVSDNEEIETVKYLTQGYFETLTNEISTAKEFQKEIENVAFNHLGLEDKLGFQSFEDLINHQKQSIEKEIKLLIAQLEESNIQIIKLERKLNPKHKEEIENKLRQKESELNAIIEPSQVANPIEDETVSSQNKLILEEIEKLKIEIKNVEKSISDNEQKKVYLSKELDDLKNLKKQIEIELEKIESFKKQQDSIIKKYGLDSDTLLNATSDLKGLNDLIKTKEAELKESKELLGEELASDANFISSKQNLETLNLNLTTKQENLNIPLKKYQIYLKEKKDWEERRSKILGTDSAPDTIAFFKNELEYLNSVLDNKVKKLKEGRIEISEKIFDKNQEVIAVYKNLKQKLDKIIEDNKDLLGSYKINIETKLSFDNEFKDKFFKNINQNQSGTFYSIEGGNLQFEKLIKDIDFDNKEEVTNFLLNTVEALFEDKRDKQEKEKRYLDGQIKDPLNLYNILFSLSFLRRNYELMHNNKTLQRLSPGEKGALLLIFYLLLDKDDKPLIIDQPEDNLDNHSVANILVPFIRKAKSKRQIILVTHNPNLAVVSDAEQVIFVNIDKENGNAFEYQSGSIENRYINNQIVKVLEGAMPAFNKRKHKYYEEYKKN